MGRAVTDSVKDGCQFVKACLLPTSTAALSLGFVFCKYRATHLFS